MMRSSLVREFAVRGLGVIGNNILYHNYKRMYMECCAFRYYFLNKGIFIRYELYLLYRNGGQ